MKNSEKWSEAYSRLLAAKNERPLQDKELETLAVAAYMLGKDFESYELFEIAYQRYVEHHKPEDGSRISFWLGFLLMNAGEKSRGSGWIATGSRLCNEQLNEDSAVHGLFLIPSGLNALGANKGSDAQNFFQQASLIGEKYGTSELVIMGRLGLAQSLIIQGSIEKGLLLLDELMIYLETENIFPLAKGIVYCGGIQTCRKIWDLNRAKAWTTALSQWCEKFPDMIPYRGQCLVRRAEVMQLHGDWPLALKEIEIACNLLTKPPIDPAVGEAYYRKAELLRLLGEFNGAEACYQEASKFRRNPYPGYALLKCAQRETTTGKTAILNALEEAKDSIRRSELLPTAIHILVHSNQWEKARSLVKELNEIADQFDVSYLKGYAHHCQGLLHFKAQENFESIRLLEQALACWDELNLPYETACSREIKSLVYLQLNDKANAQLELAAAKWTFEQLKAVQDLSRLNQYKEKQQASTVHNLSLREIQVLQLVISGRTNRNIGEELFISERTVDRHVSNIFKKLNVTTRAEATAFALKNNIVT